MQDSARGTGEWTACLKKKWINVYVKCICSVEDEETRRAYRKQFLISLLRASFVRPIFIRTRSICNMIENLLWMFTFNHGIEQSAWVQNFLGKFHLQSTAGKPFQLPSELFVHKNHEHKYSTHRLLVLHLQRWDMARFIKNDSPDQNVEFASTIWITSDKAKEEETGFGID